jgi:hypothetical protein
MVLKMGNEEARLRDGDIIYIPETIDFLAFGGYTGKKKKGKKK